MERIADRTFRFKGESMFPTLRQGDLLLLDREGARSLRCGDLAVFKRDGETICHRIIFRIGMGGSINLLEKGDNSLNVGLLRESEVLGRVAKIYRQRETLAPSANSLHMAYIVAAYCMLTPLIMVKRVFLKNIDLGILSRLARLDRIVFRRLKTTKVITTKGGSDSA